MKTLIMSILLGLTISGSSLAGNCGDKYESAELEYYQAVKYYDRAAMIFERAFDMEKRGDWAMAELFLERAEKQEKRSKISTAIAERELDYNLCRDSKYSRVIKELKISLEVLCEQLVDLAREMKEFRRELDED